MRDAERTVLDALKAVDAGGHDAELWKAIEAQVEQHGIASITGRPRAVLEDLTKRLYSRDRIGQFSSGGGSAGGARAGRSGESPSTANQHDGKEVKRLHLALSEVTNAIGRYGLMADVAGLKDLHSAVGRYTSTQSDRDRERVGSALEGLSRSKTPSTAQAAGRALADFQRRTRAESRSAGAAALGAGIGPISKADDQ